MKTANADDTPGTSSAFKGTDYTITIASSSVATPHRLLITALPPIIDENPHPHHPLFPPLPEYKPPSIFTAVQWRALRAVSFCLSLIFLIGIVLAASVSSSLIAAKDLSIRLRGGDPEKDRPFWQEECQRRDARESAAWVWDDEKRKLAAKPSVPRSEVDAEERSVGIGKAPYEPLEGGQDPLTPKADWQSHPANGGRKYPVLMLPGLLQSAGAFCANDDDSLAFFLAKSGYDIWLGGNRYGFHPEHISLAPSDPRSWSWTIRDMAAFDLPALVARVLEQLRRENAEDARSGAKVTDKGRADVASALGLPLSPDADVDVANGAWYDARVPPMALWVAGSDQLIDGSRLLRRLKGRSEPYVRVVHSRVIEEYEHLDVILAVDSIEKVGMEVRRVIWECVKDDARGICRYPEV
ncbi:hypothetical protein RJ035_000580 [Blastomyces gilchristii]